MIENDDIISDNKPLHWPELKHDCASDSLKMFQFVLVIYHGDDGDVDSSGHRGNNPDNLIVFICIFTYIIQPPGSRPQTAPSVKQKIKLVWPKCSHP